MAEVRYIGPHIEGVDVVTPGGATRSVGHGETFETTTRHAELLLAQASNWQPAAPARTPKKREAD